MSRFQAPMQACPLHSALLAHPASANAARIAAINFGLGTHVSWHAGHAARRSAAAGVVDQRGGHFFYSRRRAEILGPLHPDGAESWASQPGIAAARPACA
jgi:hypothetical protein